ncbi:MULTISPECIES: hypothetical protein [Silvimonas]|uniref:Uncharacterized protein n=2 Tax=Silvimonas TaxID=300264 RepID=A0ABQ2PAZ4_9NEIS|nr:MULTISPECIES: hypothetical protein [Silvimonas]GGP22618.1 hypothetical protein GCM10010970_26220 [Silvimonas iriomotensis]GGP28199.1 hypothetical protein GCM10010971_40180 [Silvimonas amylolytica]
MVHEPVVVAGREEVSDRFLYEGRIYISPQWDVEHAIYLEVGDMEVKFCGS